MNVKQTPYVGGQAVLEGVMMRSPRCLAIAVRRADGRIVVKEGAWRPLTDKYRFLRWPIFRGAVVLVESMINGLEALNFSANQSQVQGSSETSLEPAAPSAAGGILVALMAAFGLFVGAPHFLAWLTGRLMHLSGSTTGDFGVDSFAFHLLDGGFKLAIFVGYIGIISRIPEIRRVFEYHGAEHKVVNAYENGESLTVERARTCTTFHARCGTSFVLFVLVLSIFFFAAIFPLIPQLSSIAWVNHLAMILIKLPLMLPLSGLAYEINRYASRHPDQLWVQILVYPGRLMQRLTTREPSDDQLEIALSAMRVALRREAQTARASNVAIFRDFHEVVAGIHV